MERYRISSVAEAGTRDKFKVNEQIWSALMKIVQQLRTCPDFFIARGGTTSDNLASKTLEIKRALVTRQAYCGVPVRLTAENSKSPAPPHNVFPGNAGEPTMLKELYQL